MQGISSAGPRKFKERSCAECGIIFQPATGTSRHCPPCQRERKRKLQTEAYVRRTNGTNQRFCLDCGAGLSPCRGRPRERCEPCQATFRKAEDRKRNKERSESGERKVYDVRYRENNPETIRKSAKRYKQANPEVDLAAIHRRHQRIDAGMDALDRMLSTGYRRAIQNDPCFYCGSLVTHHVDHYFPLAKGGTDRWVNLVRTCRRCNQRKGVACGTAFALRRGCLAPVVTRAPVQRVTASDREPLRLF